MAIANPLMAELSGSIGDNVWSHNRGGAYVRRRAVPVNPSSTRQTEVRSALQQASSAWRTLSQGQRDAWADWATNNPVLNSLGLPLTMTGQQAYVALNSRLLDAGEASVPTVPSIAAPAPPTSVTPTAADGSTNITVAFTPTPTGATIRPIVRWTLMHSIGKDPNINQSRILGLGTEAQASPVTLSVDVAVIEGMASNIYVAMLDTTTGLISAYVKGRLVVSA